MCAGALLHCVPAFAKPAVDTTKKRAASSVSSTTPIVIDAVVASVDEKPITLKELQARLSPSRPITLQELTNNHEAQQALDAIIAERVLEAEATTKRVSVVDSEVDDYINEVAARNSLSRTDFENVLKREGKDLAWYKRQVKTDILKSKLASTITRGGVSVSDQEIDEYLSSSSSFQPDGASLKLRVISLPLQGISQEEATSQLTSVQNALSSGQSFEEVAKKFSKGPHAADGGLLGVVAEKDLSGNIFDALLSVEAGHYSKPISSESETQIFYVEERYAPSGGDDSDSNRSADDDEKALEARRDEARKALQKRKTDEKLSTYFAVELVKNHAVDKKF
jgi:peptidyl-prolyl cis-trans isomerase SurA